MSSDIKSQNMFSINLVTVDNYQSPPLCGLDPVFSNFRGNDIKSVPVIRVFGSTSQGKKMCLHIHGVFPYIYVPCTIEDEVNSFMYKLAAGIDYALNVSFGCASSKTQHVYKVQQVSGIPYYGYHTKEHRFFKIYFYNPAITKRVTDLLTNGVVLNQTLQPHEAHVPFILQFMIDFNLYGMSPIYLKEIKPRSSSYVRNPENTDNHSLTNNMESHLVPLINKQSKCELEGDALAFHILNRQDIAKGLDLNPGIATIWNEEKLRRSQAGIECMPSQLLYSKDSNVSSLPPTDNDIYQAQRLAQRLNTISQNDDSQLRFFTNSNSYPIEVHDKSYFVDASVVFTHDPTQFDEATKQNTTNEPNKSFENITTLQHSNSNLSTVLDSDDLDLVDLLIDLAGDDDKNTIIVDNVSILGSQFSNHEDEIKSDPEDEETDDFNMTTLQLDALSSWESFHELHRSKSTVSEHNTTLISTNRADENPIREDFCDNDDDDDTLLDFPQLDGTDDKLNEKSSSKLSHSLISKKLNELGQKNSYVRDVQDIEDISMKNDGFRSIFDSLSNESSITKKMKQKKEIIPALDGNVDPSESESEQDLTIGQIEKRISRLKSLKKHLMNITPRKRKYETRNCSDSDSKSTKQGQKINTPSQEKCYPSPSRSPRCNRGKYSQLDITITSPKTNKGQIVSELTENTSTSSLFKTGLDRSGKCLDTSGNQENRDLSTSISNSHSKNYEESTPKKSKNILHVEDSTMELSKEVRKKLNFTNFNETINHPQKSGATSVNNSIFRHIMLNQTEVDFQSTTSTDIKNDIICEDSLGNISIIERNDDIVEETDFEDDDSSNNMTFTQCVNTKLQTFPQSIKQIKHNQTKPIVITPKFNPPNRLKIINTMNFYGIPKTEGNDQPFYSNKSDLIKQKEMSKMIGIDEVPLFKSSIKNITGLQSWRRMKVNEFHPSGMSLKSSKMKRALAGYNSISIIPLKTPPTPESVNSWLNKCSEKKNSEEHKTSTDELSPQDKIESSIKNSTSSATCTELKTTPQKSSASIDLTSSNHKHEMSNHPGISYGQIEYSDMSNSTLTTENFQNVKFTPVYRCLTTISLEVHVCTREDLLPDPQHDPIEAIFYAIQNDVSSSSDQDQLKNSAIIVNSFNINSKIHNINSSNTNCPITYVQSEKEALITLTEIIEQCDPDIIIGWELEALSWGYVFLRAHYIGLSTFPSDISRIPNIPSLESVSQEFIQSTVRISGRIILDVWRIMRHEMALLSYSFENVMFNVLHERISCPNYKTLTKWWNYPHQKMHHRVIDHYLSRVIGTLRILSQLDIIGRTSEHARLFGIQFFEVFSRGTQFRVESMMLRLAKPLNYIAISPSIQQRAYMRAPESLPLIMEPESKFYTDPIVVLDFQSLYPSIIIAYNYCFSTCLGRIEYIGQYEPFDFGTNTLRVQKNTALELRGKLNFAPCGVAFVKQEIRKGIVPRMLEEILNTRLMVKEAMKLHAKEGRTLQRILNSQQLGLKLIANVTYGYTSANFSGRMPCIEVGDSVVSKGRETLERAIKLIESTQKWGAQVIYGDTDSLFVLLPGKTRIEAFKMGAEMADAVTATNPPPVKLKFEKVLHPSILQTKKRYCGYMYETLDQDKPTYLAKGIETVRRDGCPAAAKILEKTLKILFGTKDISLVKSYVVRQIDKILNKRVSIQDLTFAKEFRGVRGYKKNACVPALELTRRLLKKDPRAIPLTGERVKYVIVAGAPNEALIHCVRTPWEVINDPALNPNSIYYVTKVVIPPLNRCLNLMGLDVHAWYREMSRSLTFDKGINLMAKNKKSTICQFFNTVVCAACGQQTNHELCTQCLQYPDQTIVILLEKIRWLQKTYNQINSICQSCVGRSDTPECVSLDCPVLYRERHARRELAQIPFMKNIIQNRIH